jgi:hypothetical protein
MSTIAPQPSPDDLRDAVAMIQHRATRFAEGMTYIRLKADRGQTSAQLLTALFEAYAALIDVLRTVEAKDALAELITVIADRHPDLQQRHAAAALLAYVSSDAEQLSHYFLDAYHEDRCVGLFAGVLDLFTTLLPELCTQYVRDLLTHWAGREDAGE